MRSVASHEVAVGTLRIKANKAVTSQALRSLDLPVIPLLGAAGWQSRADTGAGQTGLVGPGTVVFACGPEEGKAPLGQ
jgi:hypothetical protein